MLFATQIQLMFQQRGSDCIKNTRLKLFLSGMLFFIIMNVSGIYALTNQITNGIIKTGIVDIKIQTYKLNSENQEINYDDVDKKVIPGDEISLIPKIANLGADCYVRLKINYIDNNTDFMQYVTGFSNKLKKYGEYYYYDGVLNSNDEIKVFDSIKIPDNVGEKAVNGKIKLEIIAQAIQEKNFQPDYTLQDPWKNVTPSKTINAPYNIINKDSKIAISYENHTDTDIVVPSSFLEDASNIMPGDIIKNKFKLNNETKINAKYYLKFDNSKCNTKECALLNSLILTIRNNKGYVIYNGNMLCDEKILLGEYDLNGSDEFTLEILAPIDLDNKFENLNPKLLLIFSSDYDEKDNIIDNNTDNNDSINNNPKTGDSIGVAITIFIISSMGLIIVIILTYKERTKEEY